MGRDAPFAPKVSHARYVAFQIAETAQGKFVRRHPAAGRATEAAADSVDGATRSVVARSIENQADVRLDDGGNRIFGALRAGVAGSATHEPPRRGIGIVKIRRK
jgi:hypothetical protein